MDCPRCGAALSAYRLSDREASVCEACGYVGVATEHGGEPRAVESWEAAIDRARRRLIEREDDAGAGDGDETDGEAGNAGKSDGEASEDADGERAESGDGRVRSGDDGRKSDAVSENGTASGPGG